MKFLCAFLFFVVSPFVALAADRASQVDDIREAIFRHQFQGANADASEKIYFICVKDTNSGKYADPTNGFMKRFMHHQPRVAKGSESTSAKVTSRVIDIQTGEPGELFTIDAIKWISDDQVEAYGDCRVAGDSGTGNLYHLKKEHGRWVVFKDEIISVS